MKKLIAVLSIVAVLLGVFTGCTVYENHSAERYSEIFSGDYAITLPLDVFPSDVYNAECNDYIFTYKESFLDDRCQIFLDCTYTEQDYYKEKKRIQSIDDYYYLSYDATKFRSENEIYFDLERFRYPAYVTNYSEGQMYEYAMLFEEEYRIVYVGLQWCPEDDILFDKKYLPKNYSDFSHF